MGDRGAAARAKALLGDLGGGAYGPVGERMSVPPFCAAWPVETGAVTACLYVGRSVSGPVFHILIGCFLPEEFCGIFGL
jgi:hypothetical protein